MFTWFAVMSVLAVAVVFRSAALDYRTVIVGSLLPLTDVVFGGPRVLHSLSGAVFLLVVIMLGTRRRRLVRRRLLGVPIGLMCHLVLDGSFATTSVFWWPISQRAFSSGSLPVLAHLPVSIGLELVAVAVAVWAWRACRLDDPVRRHRFLADGHLDLPDM